MGLALFFLACMACFLAMGATSMIAAVIVRPTRWRLQAALWLAPVAAFFIPYAAFGVLTIQHDMRPPETVFADVFETAPDVSNLQAVGRITWNDSVAYFAYEGQSTAVERVIAEGERTSWGIGSRDDEPNWWKDPRGCAGSTTFGVFRSAPLWDELHIMRCPADGRTYVVAHADD